jgi:hypothetical protein
MANSLLISVHSEVLCIFIGIYIDITCCGASRYLLAGPSYGSGTTGELVPAIKSLFIRPYTRNMSIYYVNMRIYRSKTNVYSVYSLRAPIWDELVPLNYLELGAFRFFALRIIYLSIYEYYGYRDSCMLITSILSIF